MPVVAAVGARFDACAYSCVFVEYPVGDVEFVWGEPNVHGACFVAGVDVFVEVARGLLALACASEIFTEVVQPWFGGNPRVEVVYPVAGVASFNALASYEGCCVGAWEFPLLTILVPVPVAVLAVYVFVGLARCGRSERRNVVWVVGHGFRGVSRF